MTLFFQHMCVEFIFTPLLIPIINRDRSIHATLALWYITLWYYNILL